MKPTGNTIFMTGGTSGIGLGLARRFRDLGNTVIISGRRKDLLDRIAAEDGIEGSRSTSPTRRRSPPPSSR